MGDVLDFKRPAPKPKRKQVKSDNLAYPTDRDLVESKAITDALALHHGLDVEIIPEDTGC
jgi:hypothetical protein